MYMYLHLLVGLGTFKRYLCGTGKSTIDTEKRFIKNWYQKQTKKNHWFEIQASIPVGF